LARLGIKDIIWVELLFADQIGDLAILGQPGNQELIKEAEAYDRLLEGTPGFAIANVKPNKQISGECSPLAANGFRAASAITAARCGWRVQLSKAARLARLLSAALVKPSALCAATQKPMAFKQPQSTFASRAACRDGFHCDLTA
jgi:hypothetical protein